jgi:hypothetical protein
LICHFVSERHIPGVNNFMRVPCRFYYHEDTKS